MPIIFIFLIYQLATILVLPLVPFYLLYRKLKGKVVFGSLAERMGFVPKIRKKPRPRIWLHGASVGEALCLGGLINEIKKQNSFATCYVTTVTTSGQQVARQSLGAEEYSLLPYDFASTLSRAFVRIKPTALVIVENDFWPNLLMYAYLTRVPVYLLSARLHEKSFARYKRMAWFLRPLLSRAQQVLVQTQDDATRFAQLGVPQEKIVVLGDLKALSVLGKQERMQTPVRAKNPTLLVGSLHPGEADVYLQLFAKLKAQTPELRMILAPRHFHWQQELETKIKNLGFSYALWDNGHEITDVSGAIETHDILLVCTLGKLFSLYGHADIFYLGGTFVPIGGHNLLEPAVWGVPAVVGPHHQNCARVAQELVDVGGALIAHDEKELDTISQFLLSDNIKQTQRGQAAQNWVKSEAKQVRTLIEKLATDLT